MTDEASWEHLASTTAAVTSAAVFAEESSNSSSGHLHAPSSSDFFQQTQQPLQQELPEHVLGYYNETKAFERKVGIIIPSIFAIVILVGLVGNLLVILVMAMNRQMRNSTNTLIIGLTCSDLMFLTLCVPFTAIDYALPIWVLPYWSCNVINYLQHASAYFSVWTLTLMAGDRFLAVCLPVESMTLRTPRNTMIVLACVYSVILLSQIQVGRVHGVQEYTFIVEERSACSIVSITRAEASVMEARLYFFSFNIFGYVIPLGITCVFYYFMLRRLWYMPRLGMNGASKPAAPPEYSSTCPNSSPVVNSHQPKRSKLSVATFNPPTTALKLRPETIKAKKKVTRLVLCVVVIWALCWFPLNICFFFSGVLYPHTLVMRGGKAAVIAQISSQVLAYTNSCLNPILYPLVSENFRKGFLQVLTAIIYIVTFGRCCRKVNLNNSRIEETFCRSGNNSQRVSRAGSQMTTSQKKDTITSGNITTQNNSGSIALQEVGIGNHDSPVISSSAILQKFGIGARRRSTQVPQFRRPSGTATTMSLIERERSSAESVAHTRRSFMMRDGRSATVLGTPKAGDFPPHIGRWFTTTKGRQSNGTSTIDRKRRLKSFGGDKFIAERSTVYEEPTVVSVSSGDGTPNVHEPSPTTTGVESRHTNNAKNDNGSSKRNSYKRQVKSRSKLSVDHPKSVAVLPATVKKRSFSLLSRGERVMMRLIPKAVDNRVLLNKDEGKRNCATEDLSVFANQMTTTNVSDTNSFGKIERFETSSCDEKNDITI